MVPLSRERGAAARRRAHRPHRASGGFTLVEVLVALALTLLALTLASQLLVEAQRLFILSGREQRNPVVPVTAGRLRADIQASAAATSPGGPTAPLLLTGHPAGAVRYELVAHELLRSVLDDGGRLRSRRPLLRGVTAWRWRSDGGVVSVEVDFRREVAVAARAAGGALPRGPSFRAASIRLTCALRGRTRVNRW